MKTRERQQARELRALGWSVKEIERVLRVARSSVSLWVRDVPLTDRQRRDLVARSGKGRLKGAASRARLARQLRRQSQADGRRLAGERDGTYQAGCMLYWAEGGKSRNVVEVSNSDAQLLLFFADFLRKHFGVPDERFSIYCNCFTDIRTQEEIEQFWLTALRLPQTCLRKSVVNKYSKHSKKLRTNKLPYGTCKLVVASTQIVQTIYGSIQEYGDFERPEWLD